MVRVAIAGGTGNLGLHIVEAIASTKKHNVVVLSRSPRNPTLEALGVQVAAVDYANHSSLVQALRGVHTVISVIFGGNDAIFTSQLALLRAAVEVGVKRFAPSEFAITALPDDPLTMYQIKVPVQEAVARSGLEWTIFENGLFMNYFATGTKGIGHLTSIKVLVDVENGTARVPITGDDKVCFTRGEDIGAFVAASLDLEKWPLRSSMVGDVKTYNEVIAIAEEVTGRKFQVTHVSKQELQKTTGLSRWDYLMNVYSLEVVRGRYFYEANLNSLCPEVKPVGVKEFMKMWWT